MSVLQHPVQRVSPATQAGLIHLLLQCRFDFQHRYWNLPASDAGSGDSLNFSTGREALLPLLNAVISDFSDTALGGANISKSTTRLRGRSHLNTTHNVHSGTAKARRVETRQSFQRPLYEIRKIQVRCD
jgi:hypothetical protein